MIDRLYGIECVLCGDAVLEVDGPLFVVLVLRVCNACKPPSYGIISSFRSFLILLFTVIPPGATLKFEVELFKVDG